MARDEIERKSNENRSTSDCASAEDAHGDGESSTVDRRNYLKLAGASAAALGGTSLSAAASASVSEGGPEQTGDWQLSFEDSFDSGSLDTSKWGIGFGWGRETNGSPERIVDENVTISDGKLRLKGTHDGGDYKAGGVNTKGKAYFGPGTYWEAKIKMPDRVGFLPAFWSKPNDESWPPEIDFVELFQTDGDRSDTHKSHHHIHYSSSTEVGDSSTHEDEPASYDAGTDLTSDFHIYGCEWLEDRIVHYVDGVKVAECTDSTIMSSVNKGAPFYMMLNIHIDRIGTADASESWGEELVADWVRVWEYAPDQNTSDDTSTSDGTDSTTDTSTSDGTDSTTDTSTSDGTEHYFWVRSADGSKATYAFEASGGNIRIDPNERNSGENDEWVADDGAVAGGEVSGGSLAGDGFWFTGEIVDFQYSGSIETYVDDQQVDPGSLVDTTKPGPMETSESKELLPNTITIDGGNSSGKASYALSVSDSIEATDFVNKWDTVGDQSAEGQVGGGKDQYRFSGRITGLSLDGDAEVYLNGTRVNLLRINRAPDSSNQVMYLVETTGRLLKADVQTASIESSDKVRGEKAFGSVRDDTDAYWLFDGNVVDVSTFGGEVVTDVDGTEVDRTD